MTVGMNAYGIWNCRDGERDACSLEARDAALSTVHSRHSTSTADCDRPPQSATLLLSIEEVVTAALHGFLVQVRRKLNNFSPILSVLNDELLSRIFLLAVEDESLESSFKLGHVCARWRKVSVSDPRLWTRIDFDETGALIDEALSRSGQAPVNLSYHHIGRSPVRKLVDAVNEHASHVRTLCVVIRANDSAAAAQLVSRALPVAHAVNVSFQPAAIATNEPAGVGAWGIWGQQDDQLQNADFVAEDLPAHPALPPGDPAVAELFESNAPTLTFLSLDNLSLPWLLKPLTRLSSLRFSRCQFPEPTLMMDLIVLLRMLPSLRQLSLENSKSLCSLAEGPIRPVDLPLLNVARLEDLSLHDTTHVLASLVAPLTLRLTVKVAASVDNVTAALRGIDLSRLDLLRTVRDLEVVVNHSDMFTIHSITLSGAQFRSEKNKNLRFCVENPVLSIQQQPTTQILQDLFLSFDLSSVKRLAFRWETVHWGTDDGTEAVPAFNPTGVLDHMLRCCPDIDCLELDGWHPDALKILSYDEMKYPAPPVCPKMRNLRLGSTSLADEALKNLVMSRPGCERLRSLELDDVGTIRAKTIEFMRERVDNVRWSGETDAIDGFEGFPEFVRRGIRSQRGRRPTRSHNWDPAVWGGN